MNKKEITIVAVLGLLLVTWQVWTASNMAKNAPVPDEETPAETATPASGDVANGDSGGGEPEGETGETATETAAEQVITAAAEQVPEKALTLENEALRIVLSNYGGAIRQAELLGVAKNAEEKAKGANGANVSFDFSERPALGMYAGSISLSDRLPFTATQAADNRVDFVHNFRLKPGLQLARSVELGEGNTIKVIDTWVNSSDVTIDIPAVDMWLGPVTPLPEINQKFGPFLGVDVKPVDGRVTHYVKKIAKWTKKATSDTAEQTFGEHVQWLTVKNKFFTQLLTFEQDPWAGTEKVHIRSKKPSEEQRKEGLQVASVQAGVQLSAGALKPGESASRVYQLYIGPMQIDELKSLGKDQEDAMDFRLWPIFSPIGNFLMSALRFIQGIVPNWGLSIILLTILVRLAFWPLTQKSTESMKKMQDLAPEMKELREKYKDDPQRMNQEMGQFYKQHGVNPLAGCMPMFIQIPVFIAWYGVLRVAVELRYAEFLWVHDLSEPENIMGWLNLLPLAMAGTMILQQRMTPNTMEPQQKMIMQAMPVVFLFICYGMPSGLLLYWTTSNIFSMVQTWMLHHRKPKEGDGGTGKDSKKADAKKK